MTGMQTTPGRHVRLGFLYPGYAAEDDYPLLAARAGMHVTAEVVHTSQGEDAHRIDALLELGSRERLLAGAAVLKERQVHSLVWACTSGSFVFGWRGAHEQVDVLAQASGVPASSTSLAFVDAVLGLGLRRVAVAATYPQDVAQCFRAFLEAGGIEVVHMGHQGILTAREVGELGRARVAHIVQHNNHHRAQAILVPDTALHSAAWLEDLETLAGKPVLTANQVSVWQALRLAGDSHPRTGLGALLKVGG
jgi:maleate cis-trans isomerase